MYGPERNPEVCDPKDRRIYGTERGGLQKHDTGLKEYGPKTTHASEGYARTIVQLYAYLAYLRHAYVPKQ